MKGLYRLLWGFSAAEILRRENRAGLRLAANRFIV
jgi:hypothetical protein